MVSPPAQPASRYRRRILGVGALLTGVLYVIGAPIFNGRIESDLDARVPTELEAAGFQGITASFSGQDGTLTCVAPLDDPERARAAAYDIWGVRAIELDRSCRVNTAPPAPVDESGGPVEPSAEDEGTESSPSTAPSTTTAGSDLATVHDIVAANPDLAFMAVLLAGADIGRTDEPVTLFAPSNEAFDAMPPDALGQLQNDPELLDRSLAHHAVGGIIPSDELVDGELTALDGSSLTVVVGEEISVGGATIVDADIMASNGVVHVIDRVILAPEPEPEASAAVADYDGERIVLTGVVASDAERLVVLAGAFDAVGDDAVDDEMTVDAATGLDADRAADMAALLRATPASLVSAAVGFDGSELYARGVAASEADAEAFVLVADTVGVEPELSVTQDTSAADAQELEDQLNTFVAENPILFAPGSVQLDESASSVIDQLALLAQPFTGTAITVEGHTDSDGVAGENLQLSQQRADAVQAALVERGVADVDAVGFGSEQPVLVDGVEDKSASRRVEFRVVPVA
jgi:OOP family OmpA-OmpF porin